MEILTDTYQTIESKAEGIYREKGSKFIALAYPVYNEDEIKQIIQGLKKEYFDARHHCYAFRLGADKKHFRSNDDGEPSGTAGKPILGQIQSFDLTNILIVVIRYFGGTKLGVSGLIQAYKAASIDALQNAKIISKTLDNIYQINFNYLVMNDIMKIIKDENLEQFDQKYELTCSIKIRCRQSDCKKILDKIEKIESTEIEFIETK